MKRKAISNKVRFEIFKRDGFTCQYCGATPPEVVLQVDHIHPVKLGGTNDDGNLTTSCQPCNLGKFATPLDCASQPLMDRAAEVKEREAQLKGFSKVMREKRKRIEADAMEVVNLFAEGLGVNGMRRDHYGSVKRFLEKLDVSELLDAMEIALAKCLPERQTFKYFCGICWSIIKQRAAVE